MAPPVFFLCSAFSFLPLPLSSLDIFIGISWYFYPLNYKFNRKGLLLFYLLLYPVPKLKHGIYYRLKICWIKKKITWCNVCELIVVFQPNERFPGLCYDIRSCPLSCFIFLPNGTRNGGQFLLIRIILRNVFQTAGHKLLSNCENSSADCELDFSYKKRIKTQDRTERNSVGRKKTSKCIIYV
jgi:hypothetical protein